MKTWERRERGPSGILEKATTHRAPRSRAGSGNQRGETFWKQSQHDPLSEFHIPDFYFCIGLVIFIFKEGT